MKQLFFFFLFLSLFSCKEDLDQIYPEDPTIADMIEDTDELTELFAALEKAELLSVLDSNATDMTFFTPSNTAFNDFYDQVDVDDFNDISAEDLRLLFHNHLMNGSHLTDNLPTAYYDVVAEDSRSGNSFSMHLLNLDSLLVVNGQSTVSVEDIEVSNGIIHVVDTMIYLPTVHTFLTADSTLSVLNQAVTRESLNDVFVDLFTIPQNEGLTFFAPTNHAFEELFAEQGVSGIEELTDDELMNILNNHLLTDEQIFSTDLSAGDSFETADGLTITIREGNDLELVDESGRAATIVVSDIQSATGVVHQIDQVLLP